MLNGSEFFDIYSNLDWASSASMILKTDCSSNGKMLSML